MTIKVPTPHIEAQAGDFAETVIMPGDPQRALFVAQKYLNDFKQVNDVRGMKGFTGFYKGKRLSVMASGMGQPSMGIYSYELFNFYGVENIIRIGTCGGIDKDLHVKDLVLAMGVSTNGNFIRQYDLPGSFSPIADFGLLEKAVSECRKRDLNFKVGNVLSSDFFYDDSESALAWAKMRVLAVEMESAALYATAARAGKKALCICTVSDSFVYPCENASSEERLNAFTSMMEIALSVALDI